MTDLVVAAPMPPYQLDGGHTAQMFVNLRGPQTPPAQSHLSYLFVGPILRCPNSYSFRKWRISVHAGLSEATGSCPLLSSPDFLIYSDHQLIIQYIIPRAERPTS